MANIINLGEKLDTKKATFTEAMKDSKYSAKEVQAFQYAIESVNYIRACYAGQVVLPPLTVDSQSDWGMVDEWLGGSYRNIQRAEDIMNGNADISNAVESAVKAAVAKTKAERDDALKAVAEAIKEAELKVKTECNKAAKAARDAAVAEAIKKAAAEREKAVADAVAEAVKNTEAKAIKDAEAKVKSQLDKVIAERDAAMKERDKAVADAEAKAIKDAKAKVKSQLDKVTAERDAAMKERDKAVAEAKKYKAFLEKWKAEYSKL